VTRELSRAALGAAAEAILVALAIGGDDSAYGELVRRRQAQIRDLLRRLCRNTALADDLAQQAFLQAWRRIRTLQAPGAFSAWLRKIAVSVWLQHLRAQGSRPEGHATSERANSPSAGDSCGAAVHGPAHEPVHEPAHEPTVAERLDLDRALAQLAPDVRLCIVLAYGERMSHREISEATDLPLGTVKSHITRGAARMRELLHGYEVVS
jgi:RNA polymerase sigma factor (sigma-70 family)